MGANDATPRQNHPWRAEEDRVVDWHYGEESLSTTAARVGRSIGAVRQRVFRRGFSGSPARGRVTYQELAIETGYDWATIRRAVRALGIKPLKLTLATSCRHYLDEDQVTQVITWLGDETRRYAGRMTVYRVAQESDCPLSTAYWKAHKLGILPRDEAVLRPAEVDLLRQVLVCA